MGTGDILLGVTLLWINVPSRGGGIIIFRLGSCHTVLRPAVPAAGLKLKLEKTSINLHFSFKINAFLS